METIWGFDLGTASIGSAVTCVANGGSKILHLGVRIFPEGVDEDVKPRNAVRRQKRLTRRQTRRRRWRRRHLRELLANAGLLPAEEAQDNARPSAIMSVDPYALRAAALERPLTAHELGRALLHLSKRRGFIGSRKYGPSPTDSKEEKEEQGTKQAIAELDQQLAGRTVGQFLASVTDTDRKRDRKLGRAMIEGEFAAIIERQKPHHPTLDERLVGALHRTIFRQRPTFFRRSSIGKCDLEPDEDRALKADWRVQQFELLQVVNALRLEHGNQRELDETERRKAVEFLSVRARATWKQLRKQLGLERETFTHERGAKDVRGNITEAALIGALGEYWSALPGATKATIRNEIAERLHIVEYDLTHDGTRFEIRDRAGIVAEREKLADNACRDWGLPRELAGKLAAIDALPDARGRHSLKAIEKLLPHLESGKPYMTARDVAYPNRRTSDAPLKRLPEPSDPNRSPATATLRNPTVMRALRALHELQKVANNLLAVHGRPDRIRVELGRDLKRSSAERLAAQKANFDRNRLREKARKDLATKGYQGSNRNIDKWLLWQEQGCFCAYTGEPIGYGDLFGETDAAQVDHIFPRSRSFDNSMANKVVCTRDANKNKLNRTPQEAFDEETLRAIARRLGDNKAFPKAKLRRILRAGFESADSEEFTSRQLNDTQFAARAARAYLAQLYGGGDEGLKRVQVTPGRATAHLRRQWDLSVARLVDGVVEPSGAVDRPKRRDDHRHHAIDALVVALTGPREVKALSDWFAAKEQGRPRPNIDLPWPALRVQAEEKLRTLVVSYRSQRRISGRLHEETRLSEGTSQATGNPVYVKRKPVEALTAKEIGQIRDRAVKAAIEAAIAAAGSVAKAAQNGIRLKRSDGSDGPPIKRVRLEFARSTGVMPVHPRRNIHSELGPGTSHHMALYRSAVGEVNHEVVTKRLVAQRIQSGKPAVPRDHPDKGRLVMSLAPNDVLLREENGIREIMVVRKFLGNGQVFVKPHWQSGTPKPEKSLRPTPLIEQGWRKIAVDPIGRVRPAGD